MNQRTEGQKSNLLNMEPLKVFLFTATIFFTLQIFLLFINYQDNVNQTFYTISFAIISVACLCLYTIFTNEKAGKYIIHIVLIGTVLTPLLIISQVKVNNNVSILTLDFVLILLLGLHSNGLKYGSYIFYNILFSKSILINL